MNHITKGFCLSNLILSPFSILYFCTTILEPIDIIKTTKAQKYLKSVGYVRINHLFLTYTLLIKLKSPILLPLAKNKDPNLFHGLRLPYINEIIPVLQKLEKEYNIEFQVISNQDPQLPLQHSKFIKWKKETEIEDLSKFDIGLMPLAEDKWAKGKCGFKALQYMALGIPPLVSPVGVNTEIVQHRENGFICSIEEEWLRYIRQLLESPELRKKIGVAARKTVVERYSVKSNTENFLSLFK